MNKLFLIVSFLVLAGCVSVEKERPTELITSTQLTYDIIPDEFFNCPSPPLEEDLVVENTDQEEDYNRQLVLPLFNNNVTCYASMELIKQRNEENKKLNLINENSS